MSKSSKMNKYKEINVDDIKTFSNGNDELYNLILNVGNVNCTNCTNCTNCICCVCCIGCVCCIRCKQYNEYNIQAFNVL